MIFFSVAICFEFFARFTAYTLNKKGCYYFLPYTSYPVFDIDIDYMRSMMIFYKIGVF